MDALRLNHITHSPILFLFSGELSEKRTEEKQPYFAYIGLIVACIQTQLAFIQGAACNSWKYWAPHSPEGPLAYLLTQELQVEHKSC